MNKVRRNWSRLSLPRILADSKNVVDSNKTNADIPAPNAAHTALTAAHDDLEQEYNKLLDAEQLAKTIRDRVHAKQDTLIGAMGTFASYAEALTEGDLAKLHAAGFQVAGASGMSAAAAAVQTMNLVLTMGDNDGELDASWDPVANARVYEIKTSTNPLDATLWKPYGVPQTRSSAAITGLPSGQRIWVRVRAIGTSETVPGPWSDPAVRTVP